MEKKMDKIEKVIDNFLPTDSNCSSVNDENDQNLSNHDKYQNRKEYLKKVDMNLQELKKLTSLIDLDNSEVLE